MRGVSFKKGGTRAGPPGIFGQISKIRGGPEGVPLFLKETPRILKHKKRNWANETDQVSAQKSTFD